MDNITKTLFIHTSGMNLEVYVPKNVPKKIPANCVPIRRKSESHRASLKLEDIGINYTARITLRQNKRLVKILTKLYIAT